MPFSLYNTLSEATLGQWELMLRIVLSVICAGAIGIERSHRQKEAGTRTHIIVAIGACLAMIISKYGFLDVVVRDSVQVDASRIASNILTGIGFLGAGVIFFKGGSVKGLTTSAGLWTAAGIAMSFGAGMYVIGIFATLLVIAVQYFLHRFNLSSETISSNEVTVVCTDNDDAVAMVKDMFIKRDIMVQEFSLKRNPDSTVTITLLVKMSENEALDELLVVANAMTEIREISVTT